MSDEQQAAVYHVVGFTFTGKDRAKEVVKEARNSGVLEGLKVINSAMIARDEDGKVKFSEIRGMSTKKGFGVGAGVGTLLAVIGSGGLLLTAAAGGAVGAAIAKRRDKKVLKKEFVELTDAMPNDSSAVLALVENKELEGVIDDMDGFNATVVTVTLGDEESGIVDTMLAGEFEIDDSLLDE